MERMRRDEMELGKINELVDEEMQEQREREKAREEVNGLGMSVEDDLSRKRRIQEQERELERDDAWERAWIRRWKSEEHEDRVRESRRQEMRSLIWAEENRYRAFCLIHEDHLEDEDTMKKMDQEEEEAAMLDWRREWAWYQAEKATGRRWRRREMHDRELEELKQLRKLQDEEKEKETEEWMSYMSSLRKMCRMRRNGDEEAVSWATSCAPQG